ncbi:hypothetical protein MMC10_002568 [Thelotrema lepadinum]|nr:hypothetical protein [Thelotrema lepadinum]
MAPSRGLNLSSSAPPSQSTTPSRPSTPSTMASSYPPLPLTIRFAASIPDLPLPPVFPHLSTALSLLPIIRSQLAPNYAVLRIRLIYAGRVLSPTQPLSTSLRLPSAVKMGKAPLKPPSKKSPTSGTTAPDPSQERTYYIQATFSDALSPSEISAEATAAAASIAALQPHSPPSSPSSSYLPSPIFKEDPTNAINDTPLSPTAPNLPQGFDRLLSAGLAPAEIASLRSHFLAIVAHSHTPDTMPSAAQMRVLEERWLDNDSSPLSNNGSNLGAGEGAGGGGGGGVLGALQTGGVGGGGDFLGDDEGGGLDDILWGNVMGFFWPVGAVVWLMREEGVWSKRKQIAVLTGALVNFAIGIMRAAG